MENDHGYRRQFTELKEAPVRVLGFIPSATDISFCSSQVYAERDGISATQEREVTCRLLLPNPSERCLGVLYQPYTIALCVAVFAG